MNSDSHPARGYAAGCAPTHGSAHQGGRHDLGPCEKPGISPAHHLFGGCTRRPISHPHQRELFHVYFNLPIPGCQAIILALDATMTSQFVRGVSVSARRGVRRTPKQISAHFGRGLPRQDALTALADPGLRTKAIAGCRAIFWNGTGAHSSAVATLREVDVASLRPVRRLGSHMDAWSNLLIHTTRVDGAPHAVWAESKLEELWMLELDRRPDVRGYQTQACVLSWPVGDRCILQIPDILVTSDTGTQVISVRSADAMDTYATVMLARLIPETLDHHGITYSLVGSIPRQRTVNLRMLGAHRWKSPVVREPWWSSVQTNRAGALGAVAEACGSGPVGRARALRVLAQCHFDVDLDLPINSAAEVKWR